MPQCAAAHHVAGEQLPPPWPPPAARRPVPQGCGGAAGAACEPPVCAGGGGQPACSGGLACEALPRLRGLPRGAGLPASSLLPDPLPATGPGGGVPARRGVPGSAGRSHAGDKARPAGASEEHTALAFRLGQLGGAALSLAHDIFWLADSQGQGKAAEGPAYVRAVRATLCRPVRVRAQLEAGIGALHAAHAAGAAEAACAESCTLQTATLLPCLALHGGKCMT